MNTRLVAGPTGPQRRLPPADPIPADVRAGTSTGPYDANDDPPGLSRLDLGSLRMPAISGVEIRVQAAPDGRVNQVLALDGTRSLEVAAFAAPSEEGIWDEVRSEIRQSLEAKGASTAEISGDQWPALHAIVNNAGKQAELVVVGVDGPGWMLRGVFRDTGPTVPNRATPLGRFFREIVVYRDSRLLPIHYPLPMRLDEKTREQAKDTLRSGGSAPALPPA